MPADLDAPVVPALPAGTRLLHIGPPKTGSTALQAAFWAAREDALAQGVRYAGSRRHSARAVLAVTGRPSFGPGNPVPPIHHWDSLLREIRAAREPRVVLSSEGFSYASPDRARRVLDDLDPARVHVVVTLRPVARLLVSEWQEHVQSGLRVTLEGWLDAVLHEPEHRLARGFWNRQRHDRLVERWASIVGVDRLTAVVVDERDQGHLYRAFEDLTGLRRGTLVPVDTLGNRSLTLGEIRTMEALAKRYEAEGLDMARFHHLARIRIATYMKTRRPGPDEPRIEAPAWALEEARGIGEEIVAGLASAGIRIVGDPSRLAAVGDGPSNPSPEPLLPPDAAAAMVVGALLAGGAAAGGRGGLAARDLDRVPARRLVAALARRARGSVGRRARALRRRVRR